MTKDMPNFEIPAEMRALAEKSVEQAKQAFDSFISATQHAVNTAENQANTTRTGAKEVGELAMKFAERNMTASFDFAQKLLRARDVSEIVSLQSEYVRAQVTAFTDQAKELGGQAARMGGVRH